MNKNIKLLGGLLFAVSLLFQECNIINPTEKVPTYIHIDSFRMKNGESANITAVWAYYNSTPIGAFDLPATFPVLASDAGRLQLAPAITVDGQNSLMAPYPFYTFDTSTLVAQPGKVVNYNPQTSYYPGTKFQQVADFNFGQVSFVQTGGNVGMVTVNADSLTFEGGWSGAIFLNNVGDSSVDSSIVPLSIPSGEAFIELNYNSTVPFAVALQPYENALLFADPVVLVGIKPNYKWQKFYINLQAFVNKWPAANYYLYIKTVLPDGQPSGRLLLDNIKIVTF